MTVTSTRPGPVRARRLPRLGMSGSVAAAIVVIAVGFAVFAPLIAPHDPVTGNLLTAYQAPSGSHLLGTDGTGRDILSRLIYGAQTSLLGPAAIIVLSLVIGVPLALTAAWRGGWIAFFINRVLDIIFAIPGLLLAILTVSLFGPGLWAAVIALAVAYVPYVARVVVAAAERERRLDYVTALAVQGVGVLKITTWHMFRNLTPLIVGQATVAFAYALVDLASLSFLGLAVQAPRSDWGVMVSDHDAILQGHPGQAIAASVAIVSVVLSFFTLGARLAGEKANRRWRSKRRSLSAIRKEPT